MKASIFCRGKNLGRLGLVRVFSMARLNVGCFSIKDMGLALEELGLLALRLVPCFMGRTFGWPKGSFQQIRSSEFEVDWCLVIHHFLSFS